MPLVDPNKKTEAFSPNVDNSKIEAKAHKAGAIITYISFILIIPLFLYIAKRNSLVRLQMKINESSSGIDVQLKKRRDTLMKLVDAVKGSIKFEKETQENITRLRTNNYKSSQEAMEVTDKLSSAINVAVENYPQLNSTKTIQNLMSTSSDIELEIAASRRLYNANVNQFNTGIFTWPGSVVATNMKLKKLPLFVASEEDKKDVKIDF